MLQHGRKPGPEWSAIYDDTKTKKIETLQLSVFGIASFAEAMSDTIDILALPCLDVPDEFPNKILALYQNEIGSTIAAHLATHGGGEGYDVWFLDLGTGNIGFVYVAGATSAEEAYAMAIYPAVPPDGNVDDYIELMGIAARLLKASDIV